MSSPKQSQLIEYPEGLVPGTGSILDDLDKKMLVVLRDGRNLIGWLRVVDQFGNLVMQQTVERVFVEGLYGDIERGVFLIRGENIELIGELDQEKEENSSLKKVTEQEILVRQFRQKEAVRLADQRRRKTMLQLGIVPHRDFIYDDYYYC